VFIQTNRNDSSPEDFWEKQEKALGTPILARTLAQYLSGGDAGEKGQVMQPLWGLLYLTEQALYFHHFAQQNWVSSLMQSSSGRSSGRSSAPGRGDEITMKLPLSRDLQVLPEEPRRKSFFGFLGFSGGTSETLRVNDLASDAPPIVFTIEQKRSGVQEKLSELLAALHEE
jgi:hypothetical protein